MSYNVMLQDIQYEAVATVVDMSKCENIESHTEDCAT